MNGGGPKWLGTHTAGHQKGGKWLNFFKNGFQLLPFGYPAGPVPGLTGPQPHVTALLVRSRRPLFDVVHESVGFALKDGLE